VGRGASQACGTPSSGDLPATGHTGCHGRRGAARGAFVVTVTLSASHDPSLVTARAREPRVVRQLYALLVPYRRTVAVGLGCLVLSVLAELSPPIVWKYVIDVGLARRDWRYIGWQLLLLVGLLAARQALLAVRGVLLERAGQQLTLDLRVRLYGAGAARRA
jgi:ABC-type bacteriocin/lantibiotic exporter with double-glycine peptidase domain